MTRFWWVRHAPTHQRAFAGWRDVAADLSDDARLDRLAAHLPGAALVVSSDLVRATATADRIAAGRRRLAHAPALREFDFGQWDGLDFAAVAASDPARSRDFWERPGDVAPPGGESWNALAARVEAQVQALCHAHPGSDIVAVAHFGVILTQLAIAAAIPAAQCLAQPVEPLSVSCIEIGAAVRRILSINHLP